MGNSVSHQCPHCGNIQHNMNKQCDSCGKSMIQEYKRSPIFFIGIALASIFAVAGIASKTLFEISCLLTITASLCVSVASEIVSRSRSGKFIDATRIEKTIKSLLESQPFTDVYGLGNFNGFSSGKILLDEKGKRLIFLIEPNIAERILPFPQILDIRMTEERKETEKSVIGRAAVGSLVAGSVGAVVGAVSGIGNKIEKTFFIKIEYSPQDLNYSTKTIRLKIPNGESNFVKNTRVAIGLDKPQNTESTFQKTEYL